MCDEGFDTEGDWKKHLDIDHKEILKNISNESEAQLQNHVQQKISPNESKCDGEKPKVKEPFKCKSCIVYGNPIFTSSNVKEIDDHMLQHNKKSRTVTMIKENIEEEEL